MRWGPGSSEFDGDIREVEGNAAARLPVRAVDAEANG
jgi:hypothetical protein